MFSNITTSYDKTDASIEILAIIIVSFILGFILAWLIKKCWEETLVLPVEKVKDRNNLKIIEWVWIWIEKLLNKNNIFSFEDLMNMNIENLSKIIKMNWKENRPYNEKTWPDQAKLALSGKWGELKEYQSLLNSD